MRGWMSPDTDGVHSPHPSRTRAYRDKGLVLLSYRTHPNLAREVSHSMYRVRQQDLPFVGSSHQFVGAENGDPTVSVFLLRALPGNGPGPHHHPYDEVQFVRE